MKKLFVLLAACAMFAACSSPGSKAVDYMEDYLEAAKDGDMKEAQKILEEMEEWIETLDEEEQKEAREAVEKWAEENAKELF